MARATVTITAQDKMSPGLMQAKKNVMQFQQSVDKVGSALSKAFKVTSITAGIVALGKAMSDCVREFGEADKVSRRLSAVWENVGSATGKSAKQMDDYAEALEKTTLFTSESIKEAGLLLAATESLTDEGFDRALQASLDLASAMGTDVASAAQTLSKAIQEPEASLSRLKTIGVSFTEEEKDQIKALADANKEFEAQNLILEKVEAKYKGVAQAVTDTPMGKLKAISDTFGDIKETLGQGIVEALDPAFSFILKMLTKISNWAKDNREQKQFWKEDIIKGDSHYLYKNYTDTFLEKRLAEAMSDVEEQTQMLRENPFGEILEGKTGKDLREILTWNRKDIQSTLEEALDELFVGGKDYEAKFGTVQGFMEIIADGYDPLVAQLGTITGALDEYADFLKLDYGYQGGSASATETASETAEEVAETIADFLEKYGKDSAKYQIKLYEDIKKQAESYQEQLEAERTELLTEDMKAAKVIDEARVSEIDSQLGYLVQIIANYDEKIAALTPKRTYTFPSPSNEKGPLTWDISYMQSPTFLDNLSDSIAEAFIHNGIGLGGQAKAFGGSVVNSMTDNLGKAGEVAGKLANNMATMGPLLGAIATALEYVIQGVNEIAGPMLDLITDSVIQPLVSIGKALGSLIMPALELLAPVLQMIGSAIVGVSAVFQWVGDLLSHWAASFVNAFTWLTGYSMYDPGSPGNIIDYVGNKVSAYQNSVSGANLDTSSTGTAVASAQYRGATSVTINIYQEAPVVGDNGMRQFAQMIRDEFNALDYYGVTT